MTIRTKMGIPAEVQAPPVLFTAAFPAAVGLDIMKKFPEGEAPAVVTFAPTNAYTFPAPVPVLNIIPSFPFREVGMEFI